jgi:hypothetical protein
MSLKSFDQKLARIAADSACRDFILADAKDPDMAFGIAAPGRRQNATKSSHDFRSIQEFQSSIREIVASGLVDIMLMSPSNNEQLAVIEQIFVGSTVTPAVRMNDTSDIWCPDSAEYKRQPSLPFRSTTIEHARYGSLADAQTGLHPWTNLGLYSITFNHDAAVDRETLEGYRTFRLEAEKKGFEHFLEVFAPNAPIRPIEDVPRYLNDCIARTLAGITRSSRPLFLKIPYLGPAAMEQLASYDSSLVIGVLGGSAGTTLDAFRLLHDAKKHGARAALFGRKINQAEHQLTFVEMLRRIADDEIAPREAVRVYHDRLAKLGIPSHRSLDDDLRTSLPV